MHAIAAAPAGRLRDREQLLLAWHGQPLARLAKDHGLVPVGPSTAAAPLAALPGVRSGHVAAVSEGFAPGDALDCIVVGGPCMGDALAFPTVEALVDVASAVLLARALDAPCLLYVGDREQAMEAQDEKRWLECGARFVPWIEAVAAALGGAAPAIVRTSSASHENALAADTLAAGATDHELTMAFALGDTWTPASTPRSRAIARRVLAAHLPSVAASHVGRGASTTVVVAENLQQAGLRRAAARLAAPARVEHVAHVPVPGLSASARMYRSTPWDRVPASEADRLASGRVRGAHPLTRDYFACWLDEATRRRASEAAASW